uniref:Uncharacterized protein n=1 Tax=Oryza meridionalis TaxID=40149 RepID=A0A0E0EWQ3_9ORYZ
MDLYVPSVYAWNADAGGAEAPSNDKIKNGLAAVLARFPHLGGRFGVDEHGRRCFDLDDSGALVLEATASASLADALSHDVPAHVNELYPKADMERAHEPLLQVQLTRYTCGGLVIGVTAHHHVADGQSMSVFFVAWAAAVRTRGTLLPTPFLDHEVVVVPSRLPQPVFDHRNIEFDGEHGQSNSYGVLPLHRIGHFSVHFPEEFVARLKARRSSLGVRIAVNCRGRASPAVPMDYFGNMVLWAFPTMRVRDLLSSSNATVVGVISDAVARVDEQYIQSFIDFGEMAAGEELTPTAAEPGTVLCPDLEVDSWLGFRFHELDFGGGPPCAFLPPDVPVEGILIFVPSCAAKGGIEMFVALDYSHVKAFSQICYYMD